jgi:hypothetical protein
MTLKRCDRRLALALVACAGVLLGCTKEAAPPTSTPDNLGTQTLEMETPAPPPREAPK